MGGILGEIRDIRRTVQEVGRTAQSVARAGADITGADDTFRSQDARYRTRSYNDRHRADVAQERFEGYRDRRDDDRDDDRRAAPYSGRGGQGPRGFSGGQGRGDARGGQGQGQDPRIQATEDYVYALADAAQSPAGSPERTAAMQRARDILTNPENGLIQSDRSVRFPEGMRVPLNSNSYIHFEGIDSRATSPEVSIQKGVNAVAGQRIGTALTDADIATLRGTASPAGATVPVGTGAPATGTPAPAAPPAPATGAVTPAPATGTATPAAPAVVAGETQMERNQQAQVMLERLGLTTGTRNSAAFNANNSSQTPEDLMDGIIGPKTRAALTELGIDPNQPITAETLTLIQQKSAERIAAENARNGVQPAAAAPGAAAPTATTPEAPAAPDAARMTAAVTILNSLAGEDRTLSANEIATHGQNAELTTRIGRAFDLNNNGRVEENELTQIAAAAAKPEAERITVVGGAAALNPLFAGTSFASVQPTTDVASVTSPAPGLAQTAQVNPQTGEVTPPAAATAMDQLNLNDVGPPPATPAGNPALQRDNAMAGSRA